MLKIDLKYILGETIVVTIGILIAIGIDGWHANKKEREEINSYLIEIQKEFESEIKFQERKLQLFERQLNGLYKIVKVISKQEKDSVNIISDHIAILTQTWGVEGYNFPILTEFIELDLLNKIESEKLKSKLKQYNVIIDRTKVIWDYSIQQYNNRIEPFLTDTFTYADLFEIEGYNEFNTPSHLKTNFYDLFDNKKFYNIVAIKIETLLIEKARLKKANKVFEEVFEELKIHNGT